MKARPAIAYALIGAAVVSSIGSAASYSSYRADRLRLAEAARRIADGADSAQSRVLRIVHWVSDELKTKKNDAYFVLRGMRAPPRAVLRNGGDCADKSRLVAAMLREIGIPATMAMCFDPADGRPSHTVVEATVGSADRMVVDPAFDLWFPNPETGKPMGLLELRDTPEALQRRLDELAAASPWQRRIRGYGRTRAVYDDASTINWNRGFLTRFLHDLLHPMYGDSLYRLPRPLVLEEPKLFVSWALLFLSLGTGVPGVAVMRLPRATPAAIRYRPASVRA